jgi:hypothetical protein
MARRASWGLSAVTIRQLTFGIKPDALSIISRENPEAPRAGTLGPVLEALPN